MEDVEKVQKKTKFEATEGIIETSEIDKLTDDCLIQIFQYLTTIADKIRIERVCKRWQRLSQKSWNNFKSLDFLAKTWGLGENPSVDELSIRSIDFDKIIRLSGRYLTSIIMDVKKFSKICHLLPNIRELQLFPNVDMRIGDDTSYTEILSWLISHGKNITLIHLRAINMYCKEKDFVRVLREMKQLKTLNLQCLLTTWSGICLLELPFEVIQEICLRKAIRNSDQNILPRMLKKCKKLQTFCLENYEVDGILEALSSQADTLKNLKLKSFPPGDQYVLLSTMSALIHLEKLDVSSCRFVSDAFLEVVSKHCKKLTYLNLGGCDEITDAGMSSICNLQKLTYLNLFNCNKITDAGISSICNLEELTYLNIGGLPKIRNPPLEKLTSLVVLDLHGTVDIQEECLCSFLKNAPQLQALNVKGCRFVTKELYNLCAVDYSSTNLEDVSRISPSVNILKLHHLPVVKYGVEDPFCDRYIPEVGIND